jgi:hypothetical protein
MGTTGVGDVTLNISNDPAKRNFVNGLLFDNVFV